MENLSINKETKVIILSAILLTIGILFCCSTAIGITALSYIVGVGFIVVGGAVLINTLMKKKALINVYGIFSALLIAFGILIMDYQLFWIIFSFVPYLFIVTGALIIIDSLIRKLSENNNVAFLTELIVGVLVLTLGICLRCIPEFTEFSSLVLGIILIIYAVFLFVSTFMKKSWH